MQKKGRNTRNQLFGFGCTAHFLYRLWDRKIDKKLLQPFLEEIRRNKYIEGCLLIPIGKSSSKLAIALKFKRHCLITIFYCSIGDYLGKNRGETFFISVNRLQL
jgi:hypothetical protein